MASITQSPVSFTGNLTSKSNASDHLRSSSNGACGVPLRTLGRAQLGAKQRNFTISAKVRKVKKHEYPWPEDPDPNVKGGVLSHLSPFKPLKEKPKPVTLDFEKPLMDLQKKIIDVQKMANETGLDFSDQIISLENKYQQALKDLYTHLTPIQRVNIARHPNRPTFLDHVFNITEKFVELHGDRAGYDDPAIVTGLGTIDGKRYMFIGHQKGRNTKENIQRNFGMPTPHGYRKALRMMYYADHHGFPIITFIDTPGAYADVKSEELGQGEAIAHNLRTMFGLKVPIISIVMGEGGSGGALAIGCGNKLLMLENAVFYVASPEACAAILWKTAKASPKAAEKLRITATELTKLQISDGVIPEPLGGAHADPYWTSQQIKTAIIESMDELVKMDTETLLKHRAQKFRKLGGFQEGIPVDPKRKVNMKKKEDPIVPITRTSEAELAEEVEKLKQQILDGAKSTGGLPRTGLKDMIEKLQTEIDYEYAEAARALGMEDKISMLREEIAKSRSGSDEAANPALRVKIEQVRDEFDKKLPAAPNYSSLKGKLDLLEDLSKNLNLSEKSSKKDELKLEIKKRLNAVTNRPEVKQKIESLKAEMANSGVTDIGSNPELKEKLLQLRSELHSEFDAVLKSMDLQVVHPTPETMGKLSTFNEEVHMIIDDVVSSSDLKDKIELLKAEVAKAGLTPDGDAKSKIEALESEIKQAIKEALNTPELKEKHEKLTAEVLESTKSSKESTGDEQSKSDEAQVTVTAEASRGSA
ncbi:acetyl-coenzyme A carboxylase carboxyl transferase subunit alpha, chloroplastic [Andrographis paniculata]|uniref:acetyl-coenzyme A carboxylase carboxyl transferase subunit alpha, chloroplastic n=1 Tax=Andrographis paniculata TaxID=175694 RepID=UPI0021E87AC1|nr:acetyl-coenzyme A carboxylase carboxyl transferase subunit alpha, chloroplastic [Andrographis paniculata]XP_051132253.1 acetyl-coenzyme A carboxylase carboxyl transferase subunit alpha, chloroplastic [Andrographis paniculata]XP_051132254.1 acetyl-coenzyme A carboxylase carboxyl transferase subunit alpha, chloroplastic [Andrographis paniculata]XP_051132255.1 acetyl-coenzyme A carboxylase carboxyl transferase subunit alpha, chloroplastic [Andrographis paniculata]XP_051132256.1 acetyl-coenzyme 